MSKYANKTMSVEPSWRISATLPERRKKKIKLILSFENKKLKKIPEKIDGSKPWTILDLSNNPIKSIRGLPIISSLKEIKIDKTLIENFEGIDLGSVTRVVVDDDETSTTNLSLSQDKNSVKSKVFDDNKIAGGMEIKTFSCIRTPMEKLQYLPILCLSIFGNLDILF